MQWLANNWIWIALAVGFIALTRFGHGGLGGCGGHSGRRSHGSSNASGSRPDDLPGDRGSAREQGTPSVPTFANLGPPSSPAQAHAGHGTVPASSSAPAHAKGHRHGC